MANNSQGKVFSFLPIPTPLFYGLLLLGMAIALLFTSLLSVPVAIAGWSMLAGDILLAILAFIDGWRTRKRRVTVTRDLDPRLSIGRDNPVTLTVKANPWPADVQIADGHPTKLKTSGVPATIQLKANESKEVRYSIHPTERCQLNWSSIQVRQRSPWQLVWHPWTVDQPQKTKVYPDLVSLRELTIRLATESSGALRMKQRRGIGTEFSELREYASGDDLRFIDWKATARRGRPLVRVLEPEQEQTVLILLDRGRLMTAQVMGLKRFDWGVNAALSLATAALHRGDRVGISVFDSKVETWIPPERGSQHLPKMLEQLSAIQPVFKEPDYLGAVSTVIQRQTRRALVVVLTDIVDETASSELLGALGRLSPRYLPFCVTLRDPQLDQQAKVAATDIDTAFRQAAALDLLSQRQLAFAKLKQRGVMVLDAPASQISSELVDEYLRLKAKNRL